MQITSRRFNVLVAHQTWMVRKSAPSSIMCVAKQCRRVCGVTCFWIPASRATCCTASQITLGVIGLSARPEGG
jgi:hypothetical protein